VATPGRRYSSGAIRTTLGSARAFNEVGITALLKILGLLEEQTQRPQIRIPEVAHPGRLHPHESIVALWLLATPAAKVSWLEQ
jgi:hypothetical protein